MILRSSHHLRSYGLSAMTLIEVTLVVAVLLGLISVTFVGMASYKEGANRAICIHHVANVQKAMRSYCHFQELEPGQPLLDLKKRVMTDAEFFKSESACPSQGAYTYFEGGVPNVGTLFIQCSILDHAPSGSYSW